MYGSPHMEKISPHKIWEKWSVTSNRDTIHDICVTFTQAKWKVPLGKCGGNMWQPTKRKGTVRGVNFSEIVTGMWDKLEGEEIDSNLQRLPGAARLPYEKRFLKDSSIWHTKYRRALVQESPDTSLRQQQRNIERIEQNKHLTVSTKALTVSTKTFTLQF